MSTIQADTSTSTIANLLTLANNISVRPYQNSDKPALAHCLNNPLVRKSLRNHLPDPYDESDAQHWIDHQYDERNLKRPGSWPSNDSIAIAIPTKHAIAHSDTLIGGIALNFQSETHVYARTAEIGYWLDPALWGRGIMSAVVKAYADWAFDTFGILARMEALVFEENPASIAVLKNAGFRVEGRRDMAVWKDGRLTADVRLARIRCGG